MTIHMDAELSIGSCIFRRYKSKYVMGSHVTRDIEIRNLFIDALNIYCIFEITLIQKRRKSKKKQEKKISPQNKMLINFAKLSSTSIIAITLQHRIRGINLWARIMINELNLYKLYWR